MTENQLAEANGLVARWRRLNMLVPASVETHEIFRRLVSLGIYVNAPAVDEQDGA